MKKKVVAMFLAAVMALSLVACGSKSDNGGSGDASGTETIKLGGVGTLFGQDNANDAAGAESGDAADTAADAEA